MEIDTLVLACDICMGNGTSYVAVDCLYFVKHWNMVSLSEPPLQRRENSSSYKKIYFRFNFKVANINFDMCEICVIWDLSLC